MLLQQLHWSSLEQAATFVAALPSKTGSQRQSEHRAWRQLLGEKSETKEEPGVEGRERSAKKAGAAAGLPNATPACIKPL